MSQIMTLFASDWRQTYTPAEQQDAVAALEQGGVLFLPNLKFALQESEKLFLSPDLLGDGKNINFDIHTGKLRGTPVTGEAGENLTAMVARFARDSRVLLQHLLPEYQKSLIQARTSYRPVEIRGRTGSWRKDDTRLHVDSFTASPVRDQRILRVFSNVNPHGKPRAWRLGDSFENVAQRYLPRIKAPLPGSSQLLHWLHITKKRRSAYDHYMLQLHDRMKADLAYQKEVPQMNFDFPPDSTWIVYTDQVSHAAMGGQYLLEQTFYLPVEAMQEPGRSPLRTLERLTGQGLV